MRLAICLSLLAVLLHQAQSTYVAIAPKEFHPGWKYAVQLTVNGASAAVQVTGTIKNSQSQSVGTGQATIQNGQTGKLEVQVNAVVEPSASFTLELQGSGGLTFTNSTTLTLATLTHLAFIQSDKKIYKAGDTIRFRALIVDKDLIPVKVASRMTIENPFGSILAQYDSNGTKSVYENTFKLMEYPDLGQWKITLKNDANGIDQELPFTVDEYVLPTFEVKATLTPGYLVKEAANTKVTVHVDAKYTYGKGVMGDVQVMVQGGNKIINSKITNPNGKADVEIDLRSELASTYGNIQLVVKVTDETQRMYNTTVAVEIAYEPIKIEVDTQRSDMVFHSGTPYRAVVKFSDAAGMPLTSEILENDLMVTLREGYDSSNGPILFEQTYPLAAGQREVWVNVTNLVSTDAINLKASMTVNGKEYMTTQQVNRYMTLGNATLNARWTNAPDVLLMGTMASFVVDVPANSNFDLLAYMIVSRGNIQAFGSVVPGQTTTVTVTTDMCPKGKLIVYGITTVTAPDTVPEIIADSLNLRLEHCQDKKVTPTVTQGSTLRTGTNATVSVQVGWTDMNKQTQIGVHDVYMLAVDQSVINLEGHNDIDTGRVETELDRFSLMPSSGDDFNRPMPLARKRRMIMPPFPQPQQFPQSTGELLQDVGLQALTDTEYKQRQYFGYPWDGREMVFFAAGPNPVPPAAPNPEENVVADNTASMGGSGTSETANTVTVRKDFPDTWIFTSGQTDVNGRMQLTKELPDSITSWTISAFAVMDNSEMAVTANPFHLNAFNPFFVNLNLPYSIRRTEKFELRATVFNYESVHVTAMVQLTKSDSFDISGETMKTVAVASNSAVSVTFMIIANKVGVIDLQVTATGEMTGRTMTDQVNRKIISRPEGIERMRSITLPVVLSAEQTEFNQDVMLDFSPWTLADVVPDSRRAAVKITGDMMGNALEGIDKLVTQPTGCGEQNMITTIPNIYAMAYLTAINDLSPDFRTKATGYMIEGYQRQMQYKRDDFGYSAWGPQDDASSTWLTAFVLRSFARAKQYIPTTVQDDVLNRAVNFLFSRQNKAGQFYELGRVIHDDMTGGAGTGDSLSVYIVVAMKEAQKYGLTIPASNVSALQSAVTYVNTVANGPDVAKKQFLAAITAYALALTNPNDAATKTKVVALIQKVIDSEAGAPWRPKDEGTSEPKAESMWHRPAGPSSVEITSYCVLAYITIGQAGDARELILWLQKNQNSIGGYSSTQDTVMALQAISEYSALFAAASMSTTRRVVVSILDPTGHSNQTINIDSTNNKILQIQELPDDTNKVHIRVTGDLNSLAVVKVVWYFYTMPGNGGLTPGGGTVTGSQPQVQSDKMLKLSTSSSMVRAGFHNIEACVSKESGLQYNSMVVVTMNLPSGTSLENIDETRKANRDIPRIEQPSPDQIHFYMSEPANKCITATIEEKVKVENLKPGTVEMYAYYDPETRDEGAITLAQVQCVSGQPGCGPSSQAPDRMSMTTFVLTAAVGLLLSLVIAL